jgi:hypothetical protein
MESELKVKGDLNKFYRDAREDLGKLIQGAGVGSAVIFNDTDQPITFFVYNYSDTVYWVSAQRTLVAPQHHGTVAASGSFFKVHPDDRKEEEFLVVPGKAYVYHGPGQLEAV